MAILSQAMAVLKFNQEDNGDRTTFFGIALHSFNQCAWCVPQKRSLE
ncbi:MAG: hypothetical protein IM477_04810 [Microcystis sp. M090S1]|nr:hypothetical protein [Microcystis sp. M090S1]MCA2811893.1 hypothetical protein [Microcystis sp. M090S1]